LFINLDLELNVFEIIGYFFYTEQQYFFKFSIDKFFGIIN